MFQTSKEVAKGGFHSRKICWSINRYSNKAGSRVFPDMGDCKSLSVSERIFWVEEINPSRPP